MRSKTYIVICILILSIFQIRFVSAQDIDQLFNDQLNLFIDQNNLYIDQFIENSEKRERYQPTMGRIENVLNLDQKQHEQALERLSIYLNPILAEDNTREVLNQISDRLGLKTAPADNIEDTKLFNFSELSRLFKAIEDKDNANLIEGFQNQWPESLKGIALISLKDAIGFGKCVELAKKLSNEDENIDGDLTCELPQYGKITEWAYNAENGTGSFRLENMIVNVYELRNDAGTVRAERIEEWSNDWEISINKPGYYRATRMKPTAYTDINTDPFTWDDGYVPPSSAVINLPSLPIGAKSIDDNDDDTLYDGEIWPHNRDLNHRLFASGTSVIVDSLKKTRLNLRTSTSETIVVEADEPERLPSDDSCVDIMFHLDDGVYPATINEPPFSTLTDTNKLGWCLGRCPHPVIQNSR